MSLLDRRSRPNGEIPSSSMADIAFLLLVFFLVTTVFPKDRGLSLVLPSDPEPVEIAPSNILRFAISAEGALSVQLGSSAFAETLRPSDIPDVWRKAAADRPDLIATIETHPDAMYYHMVDVLDGLQLAGAKRIALKSAEEGN